MCKQYVTLHLIAKPVSRRGVPSVDADARAHSERRVSILSSRDGTFVRLVG